MAYNALLQTLPGRNSAPLTAPFSALFSASAANLPGSITPLTSATTSTTASTSNYEYMPLLKQGDYPLVRFWDKSSFLNALAGKNATMFGLLPNIAKIKTTDYLEDESGTPLTEQRRGSIYGHARRFWNTYLQKSGRFPSTYSALDLDTLGHFRSEMERHFSELRLCDNHWKADEIWIRNYHSWRTGAERQPGMVKTEACDDLNPVVKKERPRPRKRKRKHTITVSDTVSSPPVSNDALESNKVMSVIPNNSRRLPAASCPLLETSEDFDILARLNKDNTHSVAHDTILSPPVSNNALESDTVMSTLDDSRRKPAASCPPLETSKVSNPLAQLNEDDTPSVAHDTVSSPPVSNNALELDPGMSVAPDDARYLPAASYPPSETSSHVPFTTLLPADNQIPRLSEDPDTFAQLREDETLAAALSLSLLAQPVNGKSCHHAVVEFDYFQIQWRRWVMFRPVSTTQHPPNRPKPFTTKRLNVLNA
jgi:hypothetical protein